MDHRRVVAPGRPGPCEQRAGGGDVVGGEAGGGLGEQGVGVHPPLVARFGRSV